MIEVGDIIRFKSCVSNKKGYYFSRELTELLGSSEMVREVRDDGSIRVKSLWLPKDIADEWVEEITFKHLTEKEKWKKSLVENYYKILCKKYFKTRFVGMIPVMVCLVCLLELVLGIVLMYNCNGIGLILLVAFFANAFYGGAIVDSLKWHLRKVYDKLKERTIKTFNLSDKEIERLNLDI